MNSSSGTQVVLHIQELLGIPIVGVIIVFVVQMVKSRFTADVTRGITIALAVVLGTVYVLICNAAWFPIVIGALMAASAVYALVVKSIAEKM